MLLFSLRRFNIFAEGGDVIHTETDATYEGANYFLGYALISSWVTFEYVGAVGNQSFLHQFDLAGARVGYGGTSFKYVRENFFNSSPPRLTMKL